MTVEKNVQRKVVQISYDTEKVKGESIDVKAGGEHIEILSDMLNDGLVQVTYPSDFTGESHLMVVGSEGGEDAGNITVD